MKTKKAITIIIFCISLAFIFKIGVELLNCAWLIKNLKGGDPSFTEIAFKEALKSQDELINKIAELGKYSMAYVMVIIIYLAYRFKN